MVNLYYKQVKAGAMTLYQVPKTWREKTRIKLEENGYTINEDGTVSK